MALKIVTVDGIGDITLSKRKGQRAIRVSVSGASVRVTQPTWLPFSAGEAFIASRVGWIKEHLKQTSIYSDGQQIGITHTLKLAKGLSLSKRVTSSTLLITYSKTEDAGDKQIQDYIALAVVKLLRKQAESYLPERVAQLAEMFNFTYASVTIRSLKRRWGSCNSKRELTFNLNLMSLDALHIDYVILHELTHTLHMNHGPEFWSHMEQVMPNSKKIAKVVRRYQV